MVKDATTGGWRLQPDDGTKIEKETTASNGDDNGERWKLTTTDGTEYFFGRLTSSAWTVPVVGDDSSEPCNGSTFAASVCSQAWRWNLDYVVDRHNNAVALRAYLTRRLSSRT